LDGRLALSLNTILDGAYRIAAVVGSGGFGITYKAEDINLGTTVAIKEYYPFDFGDRDASMSVRPKSERHRQTFEWGRSSFLQEARMLARFRHPSIVRVSRVFEANSTAYMVMDFEAGQNFEAWIGGLGRPPTQEELDRIAAPLLDALELMHAENFLHRDIAPDNIVVRADGSAVLLDFGAARRAVAEMSRSLTGIVKAGYSPHEQYATEGRLQGPWSDIYALGATFYRAVAGKPPEEATLRLADDRMRPAVAASRGAYRQSFLAAIDVCLEPRHSDRPQSVAQLRPLMLAQDRPKTPHAGQPIERSAPKGAGLSAQSADPMDRRRARRWRVAAGVLILCVGALGAIHYAQWQADERRKLDQTQKAERQRLAAAKAEEDRRIAAARVPAATPPKAIHFVRSPCTDFPNLPPDHALKTFKPGCNILRIELLGLVVARDAGAGEPGVVVVEVDSGSDAALKGVKPGDAVLKVGDVYATSLDDAAAGLVGVSNLGRKAVLLLIKSDSRTYFVAVKMKQD